MKKNVLGILRIALPVAILAWLLHDVHRKDPEALLRLATRPKDPWLLLASVACLLAATCCSFVRWFLLVRALDIPFTLRKAFRLGFLGYLLNFVGPGAVGGDVFKAYFVVRDQSSRRAEAVATILLDRVVGLYSVMVVASLAIAWSELSPTLSQVPELGRFLQTIQWLTICGGAAILMLLLPARYSQRLLRPLLNLPILGIVVRRVAAALDRYRRRRGWLAIIAVLSLTVHFLVGISIHLADRAIFPITPSLGEHMVISPLATAAGGLPVPGGLGTYEFAMHYLFQQLPKAQLEQGQGLAVALCYRLMTITIAGLGALVYVLNRQDVGQVVSEIRSGRAGSGGD